MGAKLFRSIAIVGCLILLTVFFQLLMSSFGEPKDSKEGIEVVLEESIYHKVVSSESLFYVVFYDGNRNVVKTDGPWTKQPNITRCEKNLLLLEVQSGTGEATRWGYFYDTENNIFSQEYLHILDQKNGKVAFADNNKVIVKSIFDTNNDYFVISKFSKTFSEVASPFIKGEFINADELYITYFYGPNYEQYTECFKIKF